MDVLGSSPFCWLEFDQNGGLVDAAAPDALAAMLARPGIEDLVVISHGWKNTKDDARLLYGTLWTNTCAALTQKDPARIAVCGIVWPAKAYATDMDDAAATAAAGQALGMGDAAEARDLTDAEFEAALAAFKDVFGAKGNATAGVASAMAEAQRIDSERADQLFTAAKGALAVNTIPNSDSEVRKDIDPVVSPNDPQAVLIGLAPPPAAPAEAGAGQAQGIGDSIGTLLHGPRAAVARFLNQLTYFEMKNRAGVVGAALGSVVLAGLRPPGAIRLHLIGHSFGARLVTSAASRLPDTLALQFFSLTLLQGAFSHNALASVVEPGTPGAFANVLGRPVGPITITHTHNDRACSFWYPLASRLSRDIAQGLGDKDDMFGAMGANGAQRLAASALAPDQSGQTFAPRRGKVNGFLADSYIVQTAQSDAHNNVTNPVVGKLVAAVLQS